MILFSLPLTVLAQGTKTVKGTVVDQNNEPIIGATVVVKGSTIGAATDLDGNYVLNGVPEDATLVFNYLGMLPQEISAAGRERTYQCSYILPDGSIAGKGTGC